MNNKFKKIISSLILALMVMLIPVEVFAQEGNDRKEPEKQQIKAVNERSSRQKRDVGVDRDGDGEPDSLYVKNAGIGSGGSIPGKAYKIAEKVINNNGRAPWGYVGGRDYENDGRKNTEILPKTTTYREYDINPFHKESERGLERIVIGQDGSIWYTNSHYEKFERMD